MDKEGKDFHHFEDFAKMYRAEVFGKVLKLSNKFYKKYHFAGEKSDKNFGPTSKARSNDRRTPAWPAGKPHERAAEWTKVSCILTANLKLTRLVGQERT